MPDKPVREYRLDIKRQIGLELGLVALGMDNHVQPYFDLDSKKGLMNILDAVKRLNYFNKSLRRRGDDYEDMLKDAGYNFLESRWER